MSLLLAAIDSDEAAVDDSFQMRIEFRGRIIGFLLLFSLVLLLALDDFEDAFQWKFLWNEILDEVCFLF